MGPTVAVVKPCGSREHKNSGPMNHINIRIPQLGYTRAPKRAESRKPRCRIDVVFWAPRELARKFTPRPKPDHLRRRVGSKQGFRVYGLGFRV